MDEDENKVTADEVKSDGERESEKKKIHCRKYFFQVQNIIHHTKKWKAIKEYFYAIYLITIRLT